MCIRSKLENLPLGEKCGVDMIPKAALDHAKKELGEQCGRDETQGE